MYAWIVGRLVRRTFAQMSRGNYQAALRMFAPDVHFRFPGSHALAGEYHRKDQAADWFARAWGMFTFDFDIHDVVVRGLPPNTRVCTRFSVKLTSPDGTTFENRGVQYVRLRWGKVVEDELYEDTQTVADAITHVVALAPAPRGP